MKKCKASVTAGILSSRYYSLLMRIFHYFSLIKRDRKSLGGTAKIIGQNQPREEWMKHVKIKYTITFIREKRPLKCCYSLSGGARRALLQDIVCLVFHRILCLKDKTQWMEDIRQTPTNGVQQGSYPVLYNDTDPVRIQFSRPSISNNPNDERRLDETGMRDRTLSPWSTHAEVAGTLTPRDLLPRLVALTVLASFEHWSSVLIESIYPRFFAFPLDGATS